MIWLAFLRSVNVGKRSYPMAQCRAALEQAGFTDVRTHIQTGNVRLDSPMRSPSRLEAALERVFAEDRGFEVGTICLRPRELEQIVQEAASVRAQFGKPAHGQYVELLRDAPDEAGRDLIEAQSGPGARLVVRGRAVHLLLDRGFNELKRPNAATRRAMGMSTNRNLTVLNDLREKWCR